ncbi:MAG: hypothetical protein FD149_2274 [Rhodospirillaceae bacterium]|nr:MAG: hypothetical protein FD149_2274 [Rhodospirillaceae bacterium]
MRIGNFVAAASAIAVVFSKPCLSQTFKVGDRVEASPLSMDSKWEPCEVIQVMQSGDYGVVCGPRRTEYAVQGRWVRPLSAPAHMPKHEPAPAKAQPAPSSTADPPKLTPVSKGDGACQTGARVTDRERRNGVVVEANGSDCRVKLDDGTIRYYLAWMLNSGDTAPQERNSDGKLRLLGSSGRCRLA